MALFAWLTVLSGTYLILPRYLAGPKASLLAQPGLAPLNDVGMEWKKHIAWLAFFRRIELFLLPEEGDSHTEETTREHAGL